MSALPTFLPPLSSSSNTFFTITTTSSSSSSFRIPSSTSSSSLSSTSPSPSLPPLLPPSSRIMSSSSSSSSSGTPSPITQTLEPQSSWPSSMSLWGLDVLDGKMDKAYYYEYSGKGPVNVYILDSGVEFSHPDFKPGQVQIIYNVTDIGTPSTRDCTGHGTFVSGIVAGQTVGVAKNAQIHLLRISDCASTFTTKNVIEALKYLQTRIQKPAVVQLSLLSLSSDSVELTSLKSLLGYFVNSLGVPLVIPAGDAASSQCSSLGQIQGLISVGAHTEEFTPTATTNYGECPNLYAPGSNIWSTYNQTQGNFYSSHSGSTVAAPFVTGVIATLLEKSPYLTPSEIQNNLILISTRKLTDRSGLEKPILTGLSQPSSSFSLLGLSLPWVIGIGVGMVILILLLGIGLYYFCCLRHTKKSKKSQAPITYVPPKGGYSIRFSTDAPSMASGYEPKARPYSRPESGMSFNDDEDNMYLDTIPMHHRASKSMRHQSDYMQDSNAYHSYLDEGEDEGDPMDGYYVDENYIRPAKQQAVSVYSNASYYPR